MELTTRHAEQRIERVRGTLGSVNIDLSRIHHLWYFVYENEIQLGPTIRQITNEQFFRYMATFDINEPITNTIFQMATLELLPYTENGLRYVLDTIERLDITERLNEVHVYINESGRVAFAALKSE